MMKPTNHKKYPRTQKRGDTRNKMEGPTSKKTKKPLKGVNHKENIKFLNPLLSQEGYPIRKGKDFLRGCLT
jgi:hypothetical protein